MIFTAEWDGRNHHTNQGAGRVAEWGFAFGPAPGRSARLTFSKGVTMGFFQIQITGWYCPTTKRWTVGRRGALANSRSLKRALVLVFRFEPIQDLPEAA